MTAKTERLPSRRPSDVLDQRQFNASLEEVARELGVSRERVRQLQAKALMKARAVLERHGFSLEDFFDSTR